MTPAARQVLRPSPRKWLGVLAVCVLLAWLGWTIRPSHAWLGWACLLCFGVGALVALLNLRPGVSGLVLDEDGFEAISLLRRWRVRWDEVARFGEARAGMQRLVGFDFRDGVRAPARALRLNRGISGFHGALPDTYGLTAEQLSARMEALRRQYAATSGHD